MGIEGERHISIMTASRRSLRRSAFATLGKHDNHPRCGRCYIWSRAREKQRDETRCDRIRKWQQIKYTHTWCTQDALPPALPFSVIDVFPRHGGPGERVTLLAEVVTGSHSTWNLRKASQHNRDSTRDTPEGRKSGMKTHMIQHGEKRRRRDEMELTRIEPERFTISQAHGWARFDTARHKFS